MLDVLDSTKEAYYNHSIKHLRITFPNINLTLDENHIVDKSFKLTEILENGSELEFKGCNASKLQFKTEDVMRDIRGQYVEAYVTADETEEIPLFKGYVDVQSNQTHEDLVAEVTAYDIIGVIRNQDVTEWFTGLTYPITVKDFRDSFFTYLDIEQVVEPDIDGNTTLTLDSLTLQSPETTSKVVNAIDIMQGICQINGRYGQIGRDGKFHYRYLKEIIKGLYPSFETYPSETTYPSGENADIIVNIDSYNTLTYEPYEVVRIDRVDILTDKGAVGGTYGVGTNVLSVSDNVVGVLLTNKSTAARLLYGEVNLAAYIPMKEKAIGLPFAECGDVLLTRTRKNIVRSYVMKRVLSGEMSMFDDFTSEGNQYRAKYKESENTGIVANRTGVKENSDEITATKIRVGTIEADYIKTAQLQAVDAKIDNLTAIAITTQNLSAQTISGSQISAGSITAGKIASNAITADKISADAFEGNKFDGKQAHFGTLYTTSSIIYLGGVGYSWKEINVSGTPYYALCSDRHP